MTRLRGFIFFFLTSLADGSMSCIKRYHVEHIWRKILQGQTMLLFFDGLAASRLLALASCCGQSSAQQPARARPLAPRAAEFPSARAHGALDPWRAPRDAPDVARSVSESAFAP